MRHVKYWIGASLISLLLAESGVANAVCTGQPCTNYCPNPNPWSWCQTNTYEDCTGDGCVWRTDHPVTYENHSSNRQVDNVTSHWNNPEIYYSGYAQNSLYLYYDGVDCACHDIDYWDTWDSGSWWGSTVTPNDGTCIYRGQAFIQFNTRTMPSDDGRQFTLAAHETGHAIGFNHVCSGSVMDDCGVTDIQACDANGAANKYPF